MGSYLTAFLVGGAICLLGQLLLDLTPLTPAHVLVILVVAGGVLSGLGWYEPLIKFAGAGATLPISSFGNALAKGAMAEAARSGPIGILTGVFELTSSGITASIIFGFFFALITKPKG